MLPTMHIPLSMLSVLKACRRESGEFFLYASVVVRATTHEERGLLNIGSKPRTASKTVTARSTLRRITEIGQVGANYVNPEGGDDTFLQAYAAGYITMDFRQARTSLQSNIFKPQDKVVDFVTKITR